MSEEKCHGRNETRCNLRSHSPHGWSRQHWNCSGENLPSASVCATSPSSWTSANRAREAAAAGGDDPLLRLHAIADAYIDFVHDQPHVHDLAYGPLVAKSDHPTLQAAAINYWDLLHDTVAACQPKGVDEGEVLRLCAAAWATVYGIARLATMGQIPRSVPARERELVHEAVDTLFQGWHRT